VLEGGRRPGVVRLDERLVGSRVDDRRTGRRVGAALTHDTRLQAVRMIDRLRTTAGRVPRVAIHAVHVLHGRARRVRVDRAVTVIACTHRSRTDTSDLIYKISHEERKAFLGYDSLEKS